MKCERLTELCALKTAIKQNYQVSRIL